MIKQGMALAASFAALLIAGVALAAWPPPKSPVVPTADGYVDIPHAAMPPTKQVTYRAVFDATRGGAKPGDLIPALNMAGSELNALGVAGVPMSHADFVIVFHGDALDGLLDNAHYRARFNVDNPNLAVLDGLRKNGVKMYTCGQNLAAIGMDPATLSPDVAVASDALLVLMQLQNQGYALLSF